MIKYFQAASFTKVNIKSCLINKKIFGFIAEFIIDLKKLRTYTFDIL